MKMEKFREQFEEITKMLSSSFDSGKSNKTRAYRSLFELASAHSDSCSMQLFGDSANVLVSLVIPDIFDDDEEMASQTLKFLGFMLYHPSIVPKLTGDNAVIIIDSLVRVITTTRIKTVCKIAVWCISVQQFSAAILDAHFNSLLKAIVHALDNPIGSLSITFEAMQAVMKLATLCQEKMRDMSNSWAPRIYRRLVSFDNREREMAEKCLPKIKFMIYPTPTALFQTLLLDVKDTLLAAMIDLLNNGMKIQTMKAWGWFVHLLGPSAMKSKHLINEMLKIAEQTFADIDPEVQIAALVAWEAMVDASVLFPIQVSESDIVPTLSKQPLTSSAGNSHQSKADRFLSRMKLIMTPLIGIISTKCDISVHVACLNTWSYLLHKLDASVCSDLVIKSVWEPLFEVIFGVGPDNRNALLWNICLGMLDALISARISPANDGPCDQKIHSFLENTLVLGPLESDKCSWKHYAIKWSPWNLNQLDFFIRMICSVFNQASKAALSLESRRLAHSAALKLFRSLLRAVQCVVKSNSTSYDKKMLCMNTLFGFLKKICEMKFAEDGNILDLTDASFQLLEMVTGEIEPLIMGSPLYKMAADLKGLDKLDSAGKLRYSSSTVIRFISYMDMVFPISYLNVLFFLVAVKLKSEATDLNSVTDRMYRHVNFCLCSYDALEVLDLFVGLLFKYEAFDCLGIWRTLAICLKDYVDDKTHQSVLIVDSKNPSYPIALHLLTYPFSICLHPLRQQKSQLQDVMEVWKQLYVSVSNDIIHLPCSLVDNLTEDLSSVLNEYLDNFTIKIDNGAELQEREKKMDSDIVFFIGNIGICILEQFLFRLCSRQSKMSDCDSRISGSFKSCVKFSSRFLKLALAEEKTDSAMIEPLTIRIFSTLIRLISSLNFEGDILAFVEAMDSPLLEWLSLEEIKDEKAACQLQRLWTEILNSFRRSEPPMKFDSSFLKFQASLLEKTLDHWNTTISTSTINFWNSTYGGQAQIEYPQNLLSILDKLYRNGNAKIKICKRNLAINGKSHSGRTSATSPDEYRVYAMLNRCSKRVELKEEKRSDLQGETEVHLNSKRKKPELTEHQREVRRAQQGRSRDCSGHGPGIRTYTSMDFSQMSAEESQESQII